jgi:hypothetical protein
MSKIKQQFPEKLSKSAEGPVPKNRNRPLDARDMALHKS